MARRLIAVFDNATSGEAATRYKGMGAENIQANPETREAKVYRDAEWNEYRVVHYVDGVKQQGADYHCDDKEEAMTHAGQWANAYGNALATLQALVKQDVEYPEAHHRTVIRFRAWSVDGDKLQSMYDQQGDRA